jgi:hypothetical protein
MGVLCENCRFMKKYCTGNKENVRGIYYYEMEEMDMPKAGLYLFYKCLKKNEPVKDPTKCGDYEPLPGATNWASLF